MNNCSQSSFSGPADPQVPFVDLRPMHDAIDREISSAIQRVRDRSFFILGEEDERFEEEFARYLGVPHVVSVGNGYDALALTFRALDLNAGDEVVCCAHTFAPCITAIAQTGAKPVLVDCTADRLTLNPAAVRAAITPRTKAILIVHLYGLLTPQMEEVVQLAERHGLALIEDAAQAHGAMRQGKRAGTFGAAGCFSFYPTKNLGALGDGGAVATGDSKLAERLRMLRNYGTTKKYWHEEFGYNSRLDEIQAAILRAKLPHLDTWNKSRRHAAKIYERNLQGRVRIPSLADPDGDDLDHVFHLFVVMASERDRIRQELLQRGIQTAVHYPNPVHLQPAFAFLGESAGRFPMAERAADELISLPMFVGIDEEQIGLVVEAVEKCVKDV